MKFKVSLISIITLIIVFTLLINGCVPKNEADEHFKNAVVFMELQMFREAIIELKNGMKAMERNSQYTNRPERGFLTGVIYLFGGDIEKAKVILSKSMKKYPGYWNSYVVLASVYISEKDYDKAIPLLTKIPEEDFGYGILNLVKGMKAIQHENYDQAIIELETARAKFAQKSLDFSQESGSQQFIKSGASLIISDLLAIAYEKQNKLAEAYKNLKIVEETNPLIPGLKNNIAILEYKMMVEANPKDNVAWNSLGWHLYKNRSLADAISAYKKALALNSSYALAWNNLGLAYFESDNKIKAKSCFRRAVALDVEKRISAYANYNLARIYREDGKYAKALEYLDRALKIDPNYAEARKEYAIAFILAEIKKSESRTDLYLDLGNVYFESGEIDNAISAYDRYLEQAEDKKAYYNLGQTHQLKKNFKQAKKYYEKALELDAEYWQANYAFAKILNREGDLGKAIEFFGLALEEAPSEMAPDIIDDLAYAYFENGNISAAIKQWKKFINLSSNSNRITRRKKILQVLGG